jgi:Transposase DDE domain
VADANETRDWRIYAAFAQTLIVQARKLDSITIDFCLSVFPWAHSRSTKPAVKMHTLLDLRRDIPSFIQISHGKLHDVHALDMRIPEAGAIYLMDRGYIDFGRLYGKHQAGAFFVTRAKSNLNPHRV